MSIADKGTVGLILVTRVSHTTPWVHIMADFIVKLPLSRGYDSILVVCD